MPLFADDPDPIRLIAAARRGAEGALNEICQRLRPELIQLCRGQLQPPVGAKTSESDLVQEALLSVSQNFAGFRGQTAVELFAWVARILENKTFEIQRQFLDSAKRDIQRESPLAGNSSWLLIHALKGGSPDPLDQLVSAEEALRVQHLVAQLPEHYQQVVRLRHVEDLSFPEIGVWMARTEPSVKNIYVRAMEILERELQK